MPRPLHARLAGAALAIGIALSSTLPAAAADILGCQFADAADLVRLTRRPGFRVLDAKGGFVAGLRNYYAPAVAVSKLPPYLLDALVISEDQRFFEHAGIDPLGLLRAAVADVRAMGFAQGGSTLTQQALKNTCFQDDPALVRKLKELITAGDLEAALSKPDILEVYLNSIFFGGTRAGIWGVQAAARVYFDKYAEALTPLESAVLIQLVPAPNRYNPHVAPELARERASRLLDRMVERRRLSAKEAKKAKAQKLAFTGPATGLPGYYGRSPQSGWFAQWARAEAERRVGPQTGIVTASTTLRPDIQAIAERQLGTALARQGKLAGIGQGAAVVLSHSGEVLAMVGGRDFRSLQWNNATQARRQPGSAFKPFVYLAALERGLLPSSPARDTPLELRTATIRNHDGVYRGRITLGEALAHSSNPAAVRLAIGHVPEVIDVARRLGIASPLTDEVGLALGISEVSLLELTGAYAGFANGGRMVTPETVLSIRDNAERTIWCREPPARPRVIRADHAKALDGMLTGVIRNGTGARAAIPGLRTAGKTGTTDDFRDAWFVGYTDRFVVGVWLGNEKPTPMKGVTGGGLPAQIWRGIVKEAHALPVTGAPASCRLSSSTAVASSLP
jgi:penicillin-binding protein 1A